MPAHEVPLAESRGRALRSALVAPHDLPPFRNSSMDGIGVRSADLAEASLTDPVTLAVTDEIPAGRAPGHPVARGECQWVMTGAMLPEGADAIVPIEDLEVVEGGARADHDDGRGGPERARAGADVRAGDLVLAAGRELSAHDVALLAALGIARPAVGPAPRVVALSTGDELLDPGAALRPGAIRDSNLPMLVGLLEEAGARAVAAERLGDDPAVVAARIERALAQADVVITLGGVSAGRHDPVKLSVGRIGGIALWRVAMKPGRPQALQGACRATVLRAAGESCFGGVRLRGAGATGAAQAPGVLGARAPAPPRARCRDHRVAARTHRFRAGDARGARGRVVGDGSRSAGLGSRPAAVAGPRAARGSRERRATRPGRGSRSLAAAVAAAGMKKPRLSRAATERGDERGRLAPARESSAPLPPTHPAWLLAILGAVASILLSVTFVLYEERTSGSTSPSGARSWSLQRGAAHANLDVADVRRAGHDAVVGLSDPAVADLAGRGGVGDVSRGAGPRRSRSSGSPSGPPGAWARAA